MNDSLLIDKLDSLGKQLKQLQHENAMDTGISRENLFVFMGGVLLSYLVYLWNKNKEFRTKRCDIAGEIFLLLFDYRIALVKQTKHCIHYLANKRIVEIITSEEYQYIEQFEKQPQDDPTPYIKERDKSLKGMEEEREKLFQCRRSLSKFMGQYKFYLSKANLDDFRSAEKEFNKPELPTYTFADLDSIANIENRRNELLENISDDLRHRFRNKFVQLNTFLEADVEF